VAEDSFSRGLLDFPHYTRPAVVGDLRVPDVLLSGNHQEIRRWRKQESLGRTLERRPDLLENAALDEEERMMLKELQNGTMAEWRKGKTK
jgi:tRNA (guanine37-N1)-methyltransferase